MATSGSMCVGCRSCTAISSPAGSGGVPINHISGGIIQNFLAGWPRGRFGSLELRHA